MLAGLRTARAPATSTAPDPLSQLQQAQNEYLHQLQLQIQHQSQILLLQQQAQSDAAFLAMQRRAQEPAQPVRAARNRSSSVELPSRQQQAYPEAPRSAFVGGSFLTPEEEQVAASTNPLVASALARRKRQSLNTEAMSAIQFQGAEAGVHGRRISSGPPTDGLYHRRQSSSDTASSTVSHPSSTTARTPPATVDPPALILSQPGEAYPSTSGSEGDDDADSTSSIKSKPKARRYSVHTSADLKKSSKPSSTASSSPELVQGPPEVSDTMSKATSRRRSHVSDLNLALGGRKQRPASVGLGSPSLAGGFGDQQQQPRSVSDTTPLSPFASTFTPLPPSPFISSPQFDMNHNFSPSLAAFSPPMYAFSPSMSAFSPSMGASNYQSTKPAPVSGTASAIRQPQGPAAELAGNFSSRLRKQAVATLLGSRVGRAATGGDVLVGEVMGLGVEGVEAVSA